MLLVVKDPGFKLNEISEFVEQAYQGKSVCHDVRSILKQRIAQNKAEVDQHQRQLAHMESALQRWQHIPDGTPDGDVLCPLIESGFH